MLTKQTVILLSSSSIFGLMLIFEFTKEQIFDGGLSPWQSHWITIIFTTALTLLATLVSVKKILNLQTREMNVSVKEEKLKTIESVMGVVHHHVNNLSNNLGIIQLEISEFNAVSPSTLVSLNKSIYGTSEEMKRLVEIKDPFDEEAFKIKYN